MSKVYLVDIENIPNRYSQKWREEHISLFEKNGFEVVLIGDPNIEISTKPNEFMSFIPSNKYKAKQIELISIFMAHKQILEGDIIYFLDAWHPGVIALTQMKIFYPNDFKIYGFFHAGSYDQYDILGKHSSKLLDFERAVYKCLDKVFFATNFSARIFHEKMSLNKKETEKTKIVGFLYDTSELKPAAEKENIVVFPHRIAEEKNPRMFDELAKLLPEWKCIKTMEVDNGSKQAYHELLSKAKFAVSFADQETFGISMMEAAFSGCIPLVPNNLSYVELYPAGIRFDPLEIITCMANLIRFDTGFHLPISYVTQHLKKYISGEKLIEEFKDTE